jgi:hypothetical protein
MKGLRLRCILRRYAVAKRWMELAENFTQWWVLILTTQLIPSDNHLVN